MLYINIQFDLFLNRMSFYFINIVPMIILGVIIGNIIEGFNLTQKASIFSKPFVKASNLSKEAGIAIIAILASGHASYSILSNFQKQNKINDNEVIVAMIISNFFSYLGHLPTYYLPVVIPILGLNTGLLYVLIQLSTAIIITLIGVIYGKIILKKNHEDNEEEIELDEKRRILKSLKASFSILKKILPKVTIFYFITIVLYSAQMFEPIKTIINPLMEFLGIPAESSAIIVTGMVDSTASLAIAGGLLKEKALSSIETVLALLIGSLFSSIFIFFKYSLPNYVAYFGKKTGTKTAVYNLILNLVVTSLVILFMISIF